MIDDPEEEAWRELERRAVPRHQRVLSLDDAWEDYLRMPGVEFKQENEARRAFGAGWVAAIRNQWAKGEK